MEKQSEIIEKYRGLLTVLWFNHRIVNEYSSVSEKKSSRALCVWNGTVSTWVPLSLLNEFSKWDVFPFSAVLSKLYDFQAQKMLLTTPGVQLMQDTVLSSYSILV